MRSKGLLIDRATEAERLRQLADSGDLKLGLLYGRRRVGKTFLLTNLWEPERAFYFTASATTPEQNRRALIEEAARWSGEELRPEDNATWRNVFRTLLSMAPERDIVLILDEFQYLANGDVGLREVASELNAVWEGRQSRTGGLLMVLSGSAIRTLEALKNGGSPIYGRLNWSTQLFPFNYYDASRMVEGYSSIDKIRAYAAFGGVPKYLQPIDTKRGIEENIIDLLLSPAGEVRLQVETALAQEEGLRDLARYQGILAAVGIGRKTSGEIAAALDAGVDTNFRRMLDRLIDLGYLESERNFEEPGSAIRYRVADPAQRMYYGLILPNESAIASLGAAAVWRERLAHTQFPSYVGQHVFEEIVRQAYFRLQEPRGLPLVENWGRWEGQDRNRKSLEVDVVARLLNGSMLTGSAKIRNRQAGAEVFVQHLRDLERLADSGKGWAMEALDPTAPKLFVSASGFKESFHAVAKDSGHQVLCWTVEDLFTADPLMGTE
jgi:AAA+ ATPase superfamily predicted ATPase